MKLQDFDFRIWGNETERYETNKPLISLLMIDVLTRVAEINLKSSYGLYDKNGKVNIAKLSRVSGLSRSFLKKELYIRGL
ncbi:hypothetical protein A0X68_09290, partial [Campylobacter jejuni]|nr:hypothetical protein [Campylobacter jejuni]